MLRLFRLRPAGLLAAFGAVVAVACDPNVIDLLPPSAGAPPGGSAGSGGQSGSAGSAGNAGTDRGGDGGSAGLSMPPGGMAGFFPNGGHAGCVGLACGGGENAGSAGEPSNPCIEDMPWCQPCGDGNECPPALVCNTRLSLCLRGCSTSADCAGEGHVCDPTTNTCVPCFEDEQCFDDGNPVTRACDLRMGRCVECNQRVACPAGLRCFNLQCVECFVDKDCEGGRHCNEINGRCEG